MDICNILFMLLDWDDYIGRSTVIGLMLENTIKSIFLCACKISEVIFFFTYLNFPNLYNDPIATIFIK